MFPSRWFARKTLLFGLALLCHCQAGEVPKEVTRELRTVRGILPSASLQLHDKGESEEYWNALNALGKLSAGGTATPWIASLEPLEQKIIPVAIDYFEHPALTKTLKDWYGGTQEKVPDSVRGTPSASFANNIIAVVEPLHREHATTEYRLAWEAWLLAPATSQKSSILPRASEALSKCGNDNSVFIFLLLWDFASAAPIKDAAPMKDYRITSYALLGIETEASLEGLLRLMDVAVKTGESPFFAISNDSLKDLKTRRNWLEKAFISSVSGYQLQARPGMNPFTHHDGKLWLPAIESILKKPALKAEWRPMLRRTKEVIEKYCLK